MRARRTIAQRYDHAERPAFRHLAGGIADIDPAQHRLVIHGLVKQPLMFTLDALARYPMVSRMAFLECGGNSAPMFSTEPMQATRAGAARPRVVRGMDRRAALHAARGGGRRSEGEVADRRRRGLAGAHPQRPLQRRSTTRWSRSIRTASA